MVRPRVNNNTVITNPTVKHSDYLYKSPGREASSSIELLIKISVIVHHYHHQIVYQSTVGQLIVILDSSHPFVAVIIRVCVRNIVYMIYL